MKNKYRKAITALRCLALAARRSERRSRNLGFWWDAESHSRAATCFEYSADRLEKKESA